MLSRVRGKLPSTINNAFNLFFEMERGRVGNIFYVDMSGIATVY